MLGIATDGFWFPSIPAPVGPTPNGGNPFCPPVPVVTEDLSATAAQSSDGPITAATLHTSNASAMEETSTTEVAADAGPDTTVVVTC